MDMHSQPKKSSKKAVDLGEKRVTEGLDALFAMKAKEMDKKDGEGGLLNIPISYTFYKDYVFIGDWYGNLEIVDLASETRNFFKGHEALMVSLVVC
jgi:hypothetical protein